MCNTWSLELKDTKVKRMEKVQCRDFESDEISSVKSNSRRSILLVRKIQGVNSVAHSCTARGSLDEFVCYRSFRLPSSDGRVIDVRHPIELIGICRKFLQ